MNRGTTPALNRVSGVQPRRTCSLPSRSVLFFPGYRPDHRCIKMACPSEVHCHIEACHATRFPINEHGACCSQFSLRMSWDLDAAMQNVHDSVFSCGAWLVRQSGGGLVAVQRIPFKDVPKDAAAVDAWLNKRYPSTLAYTCAASWPHMRRCGWEHSCCRDKDSSKCLCSFMYLFFQLATQG